MQITRGNLPFGPIVISAAPAQAPAVSSALNAPSLAPAPSPPQALVSAMAPAPAAAMPAATAQKVLKAQGSWFPALAPIDSKFLQQASAVAGSIAPALTPHPSQQPHRSQVTFPPKHYFAPSPSQQQSHGPIQRPVYPEHPPAAAPQAGIREAFGPAKAHPITKAAGNPVCPPCTCPAAWPPAPEPSKVESPAAQSRSSASAVASMGAPQPSAGELLQIHVQCGPHL